MTCDVWEFAHSAGQTTASVVCGAPAKAKPVKLRFDVLSYAERPGEPGSFVETDECHERRRGRSVFFSCAVANPAPLP